MEFMTMDNKFELHNFQHNTLKYFSLSIETINILQLWKNIAPSKEKKMH